MSRKRYRGCSPVEAEVLRKERRREIRWLALVKSAEASVNRRMRHALTPTELQDLQALEAEDLGRAAHRFKKARKAR